MLPRKTILGFFGRFVLAYGILIAPWPGFTDAYARGFRALGNAVFAKDDGKCLLRFEPVPPELKRGLDTRILLANTTVVSATGTVPAKHLDLDDRGVGWIPTALLIGLVVATPASWRRLLGSLLAGLFLIHGFILFSLAVYIWNNAPALGLITLGEFTKRITEGLQETLITQLGVSFVVPVLVWLFVTFRWQDVGSAKKTEVS